MIYKVREHELRTVLRDLKERAAQVARQWETFDKTIADLKREGHGDPMLDEVIRGATMAKEHELAENFSALVRAAYTYFGTRRPGFLKRNQGTSRIGSGR